MKEIPAGLGAPKWVTLELLEQTLRVWQPFYGKRLSLEDALAMITGVGRLMDALSLGDGREKLCRLSSGEQS